MSECITCTNSSKFVTYFVNPHCSDVRRPSQLLDRNRLWFAKPVCHATHSCVRTDTQGLGRASPGKPGQAPSLAGQAISALSLVEHFLKIEGGPARASPGKPAAWPEPGQSSQNANLEAKQCEKKEATRL